MAKALPKKLYYLEVSGKKLPYGKKGGGKYTSKSEATKHAEYLSKAFGCTCKLFEAEVHWKQVSVYPLGQEIL